MDMNKRDKLDDRDKQLSVILDITNKILRNEYDFNSLYQLDMIMNLNNKTNSLFYKQQFETTMISPEVEIDTNEWNTDQEKFHDFFSSTVKFSDDNNDVIVCDKKFQNKFLLKTLSSTIDGMLLCLNVIENLYHKSIEIQCSGSEQSNNTSNHQLASMKIKTAIDLLEFVLTNNSLLYVDCHSHKHCSTPQPDSIDKSITTKQQIYLNIEHRIKDLWYKLFTTAIEKYNYSNTYSHVYPIHIVKEILSRQMARKSHVDKNECSTEDEEIVPLITFTITTCKRLNLFIDTMNSFLTCVLDAPELISRWICVDDNSSEDDRRRMRELYPFFTFIFKTPEQKSHAVSMNLLKYAAVDTPYIFHMEDDWNFISHPSNYLSQCLTVLNSQSAKQNNIAQCLLNKNYAERPDDISITGGYESVCDNGMKFFIHEFCTNNPDQIAQWHARHGVSETIPHTHCHYWPHYSFRPSLLKSSVWKQCGDFDSDAHHFEMDYASRFISKGLKSAFLSGIHMVHTGRLTSERNDPNKNNAYTLNQESQFISRRQAEQRSPFIHEMEVAKNDSNSNSESLKMSQNVHLKFNCLDPKSCKIFVVNLDDRSDRLHNITEALRRVGIDKTHWTRYSAINGKQLRKTRQLSYIFDNNDYNMRTGMVGCAMSHIDLAIRLLADTTTDYYMILEDDVDIFPNFVDKVHHCFSQFSIYTPDLFYLCHHVKTRYVTNLTYDRNELPTVSLWNSTMSLRRSLGGTGGYILSRNGARKLLEFIDKNGMTNGIDTVQQKAADTMKVYYCEPHLMYSECFRGDNDQIDTDIQFDFCSLTMDINTRLRLEIDEYAKLNISLEEFDYVTLIEQSKQQMCENTFKSNDLVKTQTQPIVIYGKKDNIFFQQYQSKNSLMFYDIGDTYRVLYDNDLVIKLREYNQTELTLDNRKTHKVNIFLSRLTCNSSINDTNKIYDITQALTTTVCN